MYNLLVLRGVLASECVQCLEEGVPTRLSCHPAHPACIESHGRLEDGLQRLYIS